MVLEGVDEIDWFTDRPFRSEGLWKPQKLIRQWELFFETSEPNAQASFKVGEERELITFEMFKPKFNNKKQRLSFKIDAEIINNRESDLVTGLKGKALDEVTLFIDDANTSEVSTTWQDELNIGLVQSVGKDHADLSRRNLMNAVLTKADLTNASLINANLTDANLKDAELTNANLNGANLTRASLKQAGLTNADLSDANLTDADLTSALLTGARLRNADLTLAKLWYADLTGASLFGADLTGASLFDANLTDVSWGNTTCPDGTKNDGTSPCTAEQLILA